MSRIVGERGCPGVGEDVSGYFISLETYEAWMHRSMCNRHRGHRGPCLHYPFQIRFYTDAEGNEGYVVTRNGPPVSYA